jgi:hypothetical protein
MEPRGNRPAGPGALVVVMVMVGLTALLFGLGVGLWLHCQ